jgi:hypothetical protein
MVFNNIPGEHLQYITGSKHMQTIMIGANKVEKIEHLNPLKSMRNLLQLDLLNNPVVKEAGYRALVFSMFPSLSVLDTLDKVGKDTYDNTTMLEAISRIPDNLFDKSAPPPLAPLHVPIVSKQKRKLKTALARTGSLDSIVVPKSKAVRSVRGKLGKAIVSMGVGKSRSSKAGLVFPVGRVKRMLKAVMINQRVGVGSAVYMAAVL